MADVISAKTAWALSKLIKGKDKKQLGARTATVTRVDPDGTAWVRMAGSDIDTPVNGIMTASVKAGDVIQCSIDGTALSITGNATDPSVGQSMVSSIANRIVRPVSQAVNVAQSIAKAADRVAKAINQNFWTDTSGIHVTQLTRDEWESQQSGPNVLINSLGQLFRDGMNNLLSLLPAQQTQTDTFTGDGTTIDFTLSDTPTSVTSVTVGGTATTDYVLGGDMLTFYTAPESGAEVVVTYRTSETAIAIWDGLGNDSANVVALFAANLIEIGRNSASAVISFCNGTGYLRYDTINGFMLSTEDGTGGSTPIAGVSVGADTTGARARMSASSTGTSRNWSRVECRSGSSGKYIKMDAPGLMLANNGLTSEGTYVPMSKVIKLLTEDISWTNLSLSTQAKAWTAATAPKYCRRLGIVQLTGEASTKSVVAAGGTLAIGTLPVGCRPPVRVNVLCQGSGNHEWLLTVETDGTVQVARYRLGGAGEEIPANAWLPFHVMFTPANS